MLTVMKEEKEVQHESLSWKRKCLSHLFLESLLPNSAKYFDTLYNTASINLIE
jgi:hypothetical protein